MAAPLAIYRPALGPAPQPAPTPVLDGIDWRGGLLVRATNWLGDGVMSLPAVYQMHRALPPGTPLHILCRANLAAFWASVPWVASVVAMPGKRADAATLARLKALAPGASVLLPNSFGTAWDLRAAGLPHRTGRGGRGRGLILHHTLPPWQRRAGEDRFHEARHYLELAGMVGPTDWTVAHPPMEAAMTDAERDAADAALAALDGERLLVLAPGAAFGPAKQWPPERAREVARWWAATHGPVATVGTPAEAETGAALVADLPNSVNLAGKTSLGQLVYVLSRAALVVVNDSGAMHLAGALGKSGVAVFGSTEPVATGPLGGRFAVLRRPLPCSPCLQRTCPRRDVPYECLRLIPVDEVQQALTALLAEPQSPAPPTSAVPPSTAAPSSSASPN